MIIGEWENYDYDDSRPVPQAYLNAVSFPMTETDYGDSPDEGDAEITITNEEELRAWAESAFASYEIWDMEVPEGAIVPTADLD